MARGKRKRNNALPALLCLTAGALLGMLLWRLLPEPQMQVPTVPTDASTEASSEAPTQSTEPTATEPALLNGWQEMDGVRCYYENGVARTGWLDLEEGRYYLDSAGAMHTGWLELEDKTYYLRADGTMARGQVEIDGRNHFFASDGVEFLMVNPWNFMEEGYVPELRLLEGDVALEDMWVDEICYDALVRMILDCNAYMDETYAGTDLWAQACVISAYRTPEHQTRLYEQKVQKLLEQGWSREEAQRQAAMVNAYPGTSEHQLGLAVDIIDTHKWSLVEEQEHLPAQKWLMENSWRYGFILRFPKGKTDITGIIYEPWHYRYLGPELAKEVFESGLTLEEYIQSLG